MSMEQKATPTSYRHPMPEGSQANACLEFFLLVGSWFVIVIGFPIIIFQSIKVVMDYERCVIFRNGRLAGGPRGPGPIFFNLLLDDKMIVDMRTVTFDVPPQEVLTKDSVTVTVDAVVYFRVFDPVASVVNINHASQATRLLAQTQLRTLLGTMTLAEILSQRDHISSQIQNELDEATDIWGIKIERVEFKDVTLPRQLQRAMAAEAEATREAKAKVIAAEGEFKASQSLQAAAEVIGKSSGALHLRYLQTLNTISAEHSSTIVFPFPIELLKK